MRTISREDVKKRGCRYCADSGWVKYAAAGGSRCVCTLDACPYHVLDDSTNYVDWLKKTGPVSIPGSRKKLMNL